MPKKRRRTRRRRRRRKRRTRSSRQSRRRRTRRRRTRRFGARGGDPLAEAEKELERAMAALAEAEGGGGGGGGDVPAAKARVEAAQAVAAKQPPPASSLRATAPAWVRAWARERPRRSLSAAPRTPPLFSPRLPTCHRCRGRWSRPAPLQPWRPCPAAACSRRCRRSLSRPSTSGLPRAARHRSLRASCRGRISPFPSTFFCTRWQVRRTARRRSGAGSGRA